MKVLIATISMIFGFVLLALAILRFIKLTRAKIVISITAIIIATALYYLDWYELHDFNRRL